jgi:hypothetical protein
MSSYNQALFVYHGVLVTEEIWMEEKQQQNIRRNWVVFFVISKENKIA